MTKHLSKLPIPYTDYLYIKPSERKQVLVSEKKTLQTYGEVIAVGPEAKSTQVGDVVAFELWDKPEFELQDGTVCHFVRERDAICKLDLS